MSLEPGDAYAAVQPAAVCLVWLAWTDFEARPSVDDTESYRFSYTVGDKELLRPGNYVECVLVTMDQKLLGAGAVLGSQLAF